VNIRPLAEDDAPTVAALISAEEERLYGRPGRLTGADILMFLPSAPVLPAGLVLDELRDHEYEAVYEALNEAFAEHWEWHPDPFEEWLERRQGQHRDEHGPVWFVVRDGDELAAVTRNDASVAGGGYVGAIGVRPAWRGKGLGKALLLRTFAEFWRRGTTRVTLDVDSQNQTGAVRLYERAGMHLETCGVAFEKAND
jgi:ribosomal protein S18 acetylase RimI-like enzyme